MICKFMVHWEQGNIIKCGVETDSEDNYCPEHRALMDQRLPRPTQGEGVWVSREQAEVLHSCAFYISDDLGIPYDERLAEQQRKYAVVTDIFAQLTPSAKAPGVNEAAYKKIVDSPICQSIEHKQSHCDCDVLTSLPVEVIELTEHFWECRCTLGEPHFHQDGSKILPPIELKSRS